MHCDARSCRYPHTHTTDGHRCGTCHAFGHGQLECNNAEARLALSERQLTPLPQDQHCSINGCQHPWNHTAEAHHCDGCGLRASHGGADCPARAVRKTFPCPFCKTPVSNKLPPTLPLPDPLNDCAVCLVPHPLVVLQPCNHAVVCLLCANTIAHK